MLFRTHLNGDTDYELSTPKLEYPRPKHRYFRNEEWMDTQETLLVYYVCAVSFWKRCSNGDEPASRR